MAPNHANMSGLSRAFSSNEDWQDLVAWDEELYDPLFQGDVSFTGTPARIGVLNSFTSDYHEPQSATSEQPYPSSTTESVIDDPSSLEYTVSAPPSIADGPSSLGQTYSWLSASPSFSTTATSPLVGRDEQAYHGPFNACEVFSPADTVADSPVLDTRQERIVPSYGSSNSSFQTAAPFIFNPYLASSPHAFSNLDVSASQAFANVGGWAEQPQIVEPIQEPDHEGAIPIPVPQLVSQSFSNTFSTHPWVDDLPEQQSLTRAITIPQPTRRPASYNPNVPPQWAQQVPPVLSVSPEARRRPRSVALSRSASRSEPRRGRNSLTTPSPTSNNFGWVSYQPNAHNRLVPSGTEGSGRRQRGRTKALTVEQRRNAALMRVVGACSNCKKRKEKCDPGIPCRSCLDHFKGDLINHPCRDRLLSDLSNAFLSDRLGWHPTTRALESFISPDSYKISTDMVYTIPLSFGFGPLLHIPVNAIIVDDPTTLYHEHMIYSWPPGSSTGDLHTHAVLPAILTPEAESALLHILDTHLSLLVNQHFRSFPLYCSPLRLLREVYVFYRSLPTNTSYSHILHKALKLLVLVHIGGDLTVPSPSSEPALAQLIADSMSLSDSVTPTPCFIRSQFGSIMPVLALDLMKDVLSSLEQLLLNRECQEWPIALAVLITILMTIESIQYHAAKLPYHHKYDAVPRWNVDDHKVDDEGVKSLLAFYTACFSGCHARLRPDWEGETIASQASTTTAEDRFIEAVRDAIKNASPGGYLTKKASEDKRGNNMGFFFDRLVSRVLVLKT